MTQIDGNRSFPQGVQRTTPPNQIAISQTGNPMRPLTVEPLNVVDHLFSQLDTPQGSALPAINIISEGGIAVDLAQIVPDIQRIGSELEDLKAGLDGVESVIQYVNTGGEFQSPQQVHRIVGDLNAIEERVGRYGIGFSLQETTDPVTGTSRYSVNLKRNEQTYQLENTQQVKEMLVVLSSDVLEESAIRRYELQFDQAAVNQIAQRPEVQNDPEQQLELQRAQAEIDAGLETHDASRETFRNIAHEAGYADAEIDGMLKDIENQAAQKFLSNHPELAALTDRELETQTSVVSSSQTKDTSQKPHQQPDLFQLTQPQNSDLDTDALSQLEKQKEKAQQAAEREIQFLDSMAARKRLDKDWQKQRQQKKDHDIQKVEQSLRELGL